jgi:hypothetical protein
MKTYYSRTFRLHVFLWMQRPIKKRCKGVSKVVLYRTHRATVIYTKRSLQACSPVLSSGMGAE